MRYDRRDELIRWFQEFHYDPEIEGSAGIGLRYRWPPQDRVDPEEELISRFGTEIDPWVLREVVSYLRGESNNWRSRPDVMPDEETPKGTVATRDAPRRASDNDGVEQARSEVLSSLASLEALIAGLHFPAPTFGHNNPPESLDDVPATKTDVDRLTDAINALRVQATATRPDVSVLAIEQSKLLSFAKQVADWGGKRANKFIDAALDFGGKAAAGAVALKLFELLPNVVDAAAAAEKLIKALGH